VTFVAARGAQLHLRATALGLAEPPVHRIQGLYATRLAQINVDPSACATVLSIAVGKASIC
jgi:hypothetical protein